MTTLGHPAGDLRAARRPGRGRRAAARRGPGGDGARRRDAGHAGRLARHRLGRGRRARPASVRSPTSPAGPGRWSGSSWRRPVLSEASRAANFTNEGGVDERVRYLRNVMGLWLLQESLRTWELAGHARAASGPAHRGRRSCRPAARRSIPTIRSSCRPATCRRGSRPPATRDGQAPPASRPALVRCVIDSLAAAYARTIDDAARLSGRSIEVVHLVGGGARNALLCQLTADACGLPGRGRSGRGDRAWQRARPGPRPRACSPAISRRCARSSGRPRTCAPTSPAAIGRPLRFLIAI